MVKVVPSPCRPAVRIRDPMVEDVTQSTSGGVGLKRSAWVPIQRGRLVGWYDTRCKWMQWQNGGYQSTAVADLLVCPQADCRWTIPSRHPWHVQMYANASSNSDGWFRPARVSVAEYSRDTTLMATRRRSGVAVIGFQICGTLRQVRTTLGWQWEARTVFFFF